ncbi:hypothetical protein ACI78V_19170 [Geodermatophilus sp. SYSU D00742]
MSSSRRGITAVAALATALLLTGCGGAPAGDEPRTEASPEPTAPGDADADLPAPLPSPVDDDVSRTAALDAATTALTAFARPTVDPARWWTELQPLLSPAAAAAYEGTDPAAVPASAVTGPPRATPAVSGYLATVLVPTDAGEYAVLLVREGDGAPWLVERITPVESTGTATPEALTPPPATDAPGTAP